MLGLLAALPFTQPAHAQSVPGPDARAEATEQRMTDEERFRLLHGILPISLPGRPKKVYPVKPMTGYIEGVPRLGIPDLLETDASLGVTNLLMLRRGDVATAMPAGSAIAASFDPGLAYRIGATVGGEARAKGFNILLGGGVDLVRDPRNGRNFEYLGEDPLLAGTLAGAAVRGTQSMGVVSTVKHFVLNAQETLRNTLDARIGEAAFRESDLLAFQIAVEHGQPGALMCGYNKVNGDYACGSDFLLNRVVKGDWRFPGWIMSDWGAVHDVSYYNKGLDQQSGSQLDGTTWFDKPLQAELAAGRITRAQISQSVRRILRSLYAVGADRPYPETPIDYQANAKVAREAAVAGIVLLKNDGILPLAASAKHILIVGGHADSGVLSGGGSSGVTPSNGTPTTVMLGTGMFGRAVYLPSSPMTALKAAMPGAEIRYETGYHAANAIAHAANADVVIVFATQWTTEAEDSAMELPEGQDALIAALAAANPNVVVVLETGNPVGMPWAGAVRGIVEAWYPGQEGGPVIADILTGAVNPSGHLPMTFPVDEAQLPRPIIPGLGLPDKSPVAVEYVEGSDVGYRWFAAKGLKPLYPFGHGLSYTSFTQSQLTIDARTLTAHLVVSNTGKRAGATVSQLYLVSAAGRARQRLVGFARVNLAPGESKPVTLAIDKRVLADWQGDGWTIAGGSYMFAPGASAIDLGTPTTVRLAKRHWR